MAKKSSGPLPERSKEAVGKRLVLLRDVLGLQAKDMAGTIGVAQNTYSQWETGKRMADLQAMMRLWDKTGADLNFVFLGRTDTMPFDLASRIRNRLSDEESPIAAE